MSVVEAEVVKKLEYFPTAALIARVAGQPVQELPQDLYIPPDALLVVLDVFEGPLDLLLYLIRKHNLDILDIPVAKITAQYVEYVEVMRVFKLELAAEYLEMAAILAEIKSRMLLPRPPTEEEEELDPRAELVRRLQEYEQIKSAAMNLEAMPRVGRDFVKAQSKPPSFNLVRPQPEVSMDELVQAFQDVLKRVDLQVAHNIEREQLSVRERMTIILSKLEGDSFVEFSNFFDAEEGRLGVVVTFLAILEMTKERVLELIQSEPFAPIYVRLAAC